MLINKNNKNYKTKSDSPNDNWLNSEEYYLVEDFSSLYYKIINLYPRFDFVLDEHDKLVDIEETPKTDEEVKEERVIIINNQIASLKMEIQESDYKIIKAYEYSLSNLELPYNISELHTQRQSKRDEINQLETELLSLQAE